MSQVYSDKSRKKDPHALPDVEVFYVSQTEVNYNLENLDHADEDVMTEAGWYWWTCSPGCLPDSDPIGPFKTKKLAIENAQNAHEE